MSPADPPPIPTAPAAPPPWRRLVLPLAALALLVALGSALGYRWLAEEVRRETHRTLAVISEQKRQQVEAWLGEVRLDTELHFADDALIPALVARWQAGGRRDDALRQRLDQGVRELLRRRGWAGLTLMDTQGHPLLTAGDAAAAADAAAQAEAARALLRTPRLVLVDLHRDADGAARHGVLVPIGGVGDGVEGGPAPLGVAYLSFRADQVLQPLVGTWPVPTRTAETYLVRRDADAVRFLTPLRHQPGAALALTRPLASADLPAARAALGARGILSGGRDYRGVPVLAYATPVAGTPWLLLAEIDEQEAYAGVRTLAWSTAVVIALVLGGLLAGGLALWRRERDRHALAALQAQRAAEARFRVVFEQAPLGLVLLDPASGRVLEANARFADIVGRPVATLPGTDPLELTHPDDRDASVALARRLAGAGPDEAGGAPDDAGSAGQRLHKRYRRPDGRTVWASITSARVQVGDDGTPRVLTIVEDITERKRMEQALQQAHAAAEQANAAKSEFLAHMSHEIRTPMNAVLGLAQVLEREPLPEHQRQLVERIRGAGQSLLALLNDVLDLSKIEAGQLRIEPRPFDLGRLLANLDSLMGQAARAKGLAMQVRPPQLPGGGAPGGLVGDGLRLEQVLFNLVGNAVKFTERGEVVVEVAVVDAPPPAAADDAGGAPLRLRFEVRDTGIGIAPEALAALFQPFSQADGGIALRYGGTGLGLAICKRLVEAMGGRIGVASRPGQGSRFWFELPFGTAPGEPPELAPAAPPRRAGGPRLAGAHLLVVDDSAMNRDVVERALKLEGAGATLAGDGAQALQLLRSRPDAFDAVLMDVQMPVMDGLSAVRAIRGELGLRTLPVIAFTAGVRADQHAAARAAGADDVLAKPMDLDQMVELLGRWVRPRAATAAAGGAGAAQAPDLAPPAAAVAPPADIARGGDRDGDGAGFPEIAGIDGARAARRLGGDRAMFLDLLRLFVADHGDAVAQARRDLARGDRDQAGRRLHTLRSAAGFLGALDLMASAEELEEAIDRGRDGLDAALDDVERQIAEIVAASAPWR